MSVMIGVLLDVSGSMKRSIYGGSMESIRGQLVKKRGGWAKSIFKVVVDLINNDHSKGNSVFALGVGGSSDPGVFDMLNTLRFCSPSCRTKLEILHQVLKILEENGAPWVRKWVEIEDLDDAVSYDDAKLMLDQLQHDPSFRKIFVYDCLPVQCWDFMKYFWFGEEATHDTIKAVFEKGMALARKVVLADIGESSVMKVQEAHEILHGCVEDDDAELTDGRVDQLMEAVRPFIFGRTPLIKALNHARDLFALPEHQEHHKLLFVLSDGEPTDGNNPPISVLSDLGVTTICCFITDRSIPDPLRLYSIADQSWDGPAKFMFKLSSIFTTQPIPRHKGWTTDVTNNETRLFWQVNHPDFISNICDFARNIVCCQDALSDHLATVSLDLYINKANQCFGAKKQEGGTCYANASAAVLHLAMMRIVGRKGGYPKFFVIRDDLIKKYGVNGADTWQVLLEVCPGFRLQCRVVDVVGAMKAVKAKHPVVAKFRLTDSEWDSFRGFFDRNNDGVLTRSDIDISKRPQNAKLSGHAVVLTSYNSGCLRLMNSWGSDWGDAGFFRVKNADVLGLEFDDVFWTSADLLQEEKNAYARMGTEEVSIMMSYLKGRHVEYKCPLCSEVSKAVDYLGRLLQAKCPRCNKTFKTHDAGDHLAMSMYLMSLCK